MTEVFHGAPLRRDLAAQATGPNFSCTTKPITPLTDVSDTAGKTAIKASIDEMAPTGNTNVPEGMAWGWRAVSHGAPFTDGRPDTEKGNDKVVIVLTDGANTYYTPLADQRHGRQQVDLCGLWLCRPFDAGLFDLAHLPGHVGVISKTDYSNGNYTKAMNEHFKTLCDNAKAAGVIVMTVRSTSARATRPKRRRSMR